MYLLASQEFADLVSRDDGRPIFRWIREVDPRQNSLFVSVLSVGMLSAEIERLPSQERGHWRRLLAEARRTFVDAGGFIGIDLPIVDIWSSDLRPLELYDEDETTGERGPLGEDERLVIATAIARNLTLVSRPRAYLDEICEATTLTAVEP